MQCVLNAGLLFLHFDLGSSANLDHGYTTGELGDSLLQLLAIVVGTGVLDLDADFADTCLDGLAVTGTIDDGGVVLVHGDALGRTQVLQRRALEIQAHFLGDHRAAGQDRNILQHGLTTVTETGRLTGCNFNDTAHVVDDQSGQRLTFHVLSNDHQGLGSLGNLLKYRQQLTDIGDLLVDQQHVGVIYFRLHVVLVVDEVG